MPSEPPASNSHVPGGVINPSSGAGAGDAGMAKAPQGADAEFVDKAAIGGKAEVQASQLALKQSKSADVRAFAKRMVADHSKANAQLNQIAARKGIKPQVEQVTDPDVEALRGKQGKDFDSAYVAAAGPEAHRKTIALFETEARDGKDVQLRVQQATLPKLKHHLSMAEALQRKVARSNARPVQPRAAYAARIFRRSSHGPTAIEARRHPRTALSGIRDRAWRRADLRGRAPVQPTRTCTRNGRNIIARPCITRKCCARCSKRSASIRTRSRPAVPLSRPPASRWCR
jgi:putative membrane protein